MTDLCSKSNDNYSAAYHLHKGKFYCSVMHCAYYSCYQGLLCIWLEKMKLTEEELRSATNARNRQRYSSHSYLLYRVREYLAKHNTEQAIRLTEGMIKLKELRTQADYKNSLMLIGESERTLYWLSETKALIKKNLYDQESN